MSWNVEALNSVAFYNIIRKICRIMNYGRVAKNGSNKCYFSCYNGYLE